MKISHIFTVPSVGKKDVPIIQNVQKELGFECPKEVLCEIDLQKRYKGRISELSRISKGSNCKRN